MISKIEASQYFEIEKATMTHEQIEAAFKRGVIKMSAIIPANFNEDLLHQNKAQLKLLPMHLIQIRQIRLPIILYRLSTRL